MKNIRIGDKVKVLVGYNKFSEGIIATEITDEDRCGVDVMVNGEKKTLWYYVSEIELISEKDLYYKGWQVVESLPDGYKEDKTAGSPYPCSVFITNGKSPLSNDHDRKILIKKSKERDKEVKRFLCEIKKNKNIQNEKTPKKLNDLDRLRPIQSIYNDVMLDPVVCEIEGWDKQEYLNIIKDELNGIKEK